MLGAGLYIKFITKSPVEQPEINPPSYMEEKKLNIQQHSYVTDIIESDIENSEPKNNLQNTSDVQAGQSLSSKVFVREIPIQLEPEIDEHLAQFRSKAKLLNQEFPDSFLISLDTSEKIIALTFDDGPDEKATLEVVNILNKYGIPGTFFMLGQQMDRYPETVKTILDTGHSIGNHSWSHERPTDISTNEVLDEVNKAEQRITDYGIDTKLYRPPYGLVNRSQMPALVEAGYRVICWSVDSMDWYFDNPEQIVTCVVENAHPGAIVLMHSAGGRDNRDAAIEALPVIIETLLYEGYRFVGLGQD
jgi:peptidoglycan/xylan/chitin deacetylase (PgdA/CDA1 family)